MRLVFIHGAGSSSLSFYYQTRYFQNSEAIDLPGHPEREPCASVKEYVDWLRAYIIGQGYQDVVLVGHSMGGAIAQTYALEYAQYLAGLVLVGTGARLRVSPTYLDGCKAAIQDSTAWLENYRLNLAGVEPFLQQMLVDKHLEIGPAVQLNDFLCCDVFDIMDRVHQIYVPTLVICGSKDIMTPVKYASYLANYISDARCRIIRNATHAVLLEKPQQANKAIEEFVNQLKRGTELQKI